jgi:hypothetical protein
MVMMRRTHALQHHYVKESLGLSVAVSVSPTAAQKNKISILAKICATIMRMESKPLQSVTISEPLPDRIARGRPAVDRETMFTLLGTMEVGGAAIEVNRALRSVQGYVQRFRARQADVDPQYLLRVGRPGWTKVWRVK